MTNQWDRDQTLAYDQPSARHREITDEEIEHLRHKPGVLERLLERFVFSRKRRHADIGHKPVSHPGAQLRNADFANRFLVEADFTGSDLVRANFTCARLERAMFRDADLREANLVEAILVGADLTGANLAGANLIGADFTGADLTGADLTGSYVWGADFNNCDLRQTNLTGAYAGGAFFSHARNLTLEQFRSTIHDETGAYRLSMLPDSHSESRPSRG